MDGSGKGGAAMGQAKLKVVAAPEPGPLEQHVGFLLRVAQQRSTAIFSARMIEGLTPTQFAALATLSKAGPCSQNQLGRLICLDAATIKGVVDRLGARGLVTALADPKDRRRRAVALTGRGRAVTEAAMQVAARISAETLAPLSAEERSLALRLLKKLG